MKIDKNQKIQIALPLEIQNWKNCYICINSILESTKSFVKFYLLENSLDDMQRQFYYDLEEKYKEYCSIKFINVPIESFKELHLIGSQGLNGWYRMMLPTLCPEVDKIIFISGGANLVLDDLSELYNFDLKGNAVGLCEKIVKNSQYKDDNNDFYGCLHVLLFDCIKLRKSDIVDKLKKYIKNNSTNIFDIELAINTIFKGNKIKLPSKYCYQDDWFTKFANKEILKSKDYKLAKKSPIIIAYEGFAPIFINCKHPQKQLWWKYTELAPFKIEEIQSYHLAETSAENSFKYTWLLSRIWPYIKPYWFRILLGFLIAIPLGLLDGVTAFALKPYMDYVISGKALEYSWNGLNISISSIQMAWILPVGVIAFAAIQGVLRYLNGYFSTWTSQRITNDVKFDLFKRLIYMHPQFFDDNSSGVVISRYMGDPGTASAGIVDNVKTITTSLCGALGLIAVMLYSSWKLAFIGVLVLCIAFIPVILIRNRIKEASNKNMVIGSNITTNMNETYSGNKVMTAYKLQDRQNKYFVEQTWKSFNINMSLYKRAGWMSPMMYLIASCGIATVLGVGTYLINSGQMTAGAFASFVTSLLLLYKPVKTLGNTLTGIQNIFVAMGRVFELFDLTPAIKDCKNPKTLEKLKNSIDFENVDFEYIPNKPVLKKLNLHISKNETLAIVGNSGGGKSTLVNLIPRFYDIKNGSIKFDGVDIREYSLDSLRENVSMVFQDNFLFSGTIKENIMMGNPNASVDELMQAIKLAHLEEMIFELPDGLDTELGERGLTLSGGQRQRVAIARAMLRNAPIVILDEATSALDNESEAIVQKAMDNLMQNRTVFIIAHRLSTIKNADRIAVINEGELVELGTHDELMNIQDGQYKALYEMQFKKQETLIV
jgi:subfamily B ATP-binding cassette protein MsbA